MPQSLSHQQSRHLNQPGRNPPHHLLRELFEYLLVILTTVNILHRGGHIAIYQIQLLCKTQRFRHQIRHNIAKDIEPKLLTAILLLTSSSSSCHLFSWYLCTYVNFFCSWKCLNMQMSENDRKKIITHAKLPATIPPCQVSDDKLIFTETAG